MRQHVRYAVRNVQREEVGFLDLLFEADDKIPTEIYQLSLSGERMARFVRIDGDAVALWPLGKPK